MRIGIDFDDVLLDCNTSLLHFHNSRYGTSYERKDIRTFHLEDLWGCIREEMVNRIREWYESPEHNESELIDGSKNAIETLVKEHELHIITSRSEMMRDATVAWLDRHFSGNFAGVHFTGLSNGGHGTKVEVCKELQISFLVDDALMNARAVADAGIPVLLLDSPWNQELIAPPIVRVSGWGDVLDYVGRMKVFVSEESSHE